MDIRSLRHIVTLARRRSYTKAADELGLSQPALSRSIQAVEARAKVKLFDRDRGGVQVTPIGREFAERAASVLRDMSDLERLLSNAAGGAHEVRFGMAPLPAAALLSPVITRNLREAPGLRSRVAVRRAEALLALLMAEEIEFFVSAERQVAASAPVKSAVLGRLSASLIVRNGHPLLEEGGGGLEAYPWIVSRELDETQGATEYDVMPRGISPTVVLEDHGALVQITEHSDAIWLSSAYAVTGEIKAGRLRELPPPPGWRSPRFRMLMYTLERRTLSPAAQRLQAEFKSQIQTLVVHSGD